jgi:16S rRNA (cytidine1402-2'-O)-methyltransferase
MLYIGANHLGNISDTPIRVIELLETVDIVVIENKQFFVKDMEELQIPTPKILLLKQEKEFDDKVIRLLKDQKSVLLMTEHGYPGIADPGQSLVNMAIDEGIEIRVIPGPSIGPMALAVSGWNAKGSILIETFGQSSEQIELRLSSLKDLEYPIVVLDHKERMIDIVKIAEKILYSRKVLLCINLGRDSDQKILRLDYEDMIGLIEKSTSEELFGPKRNRPVSTLVFGPINSFGA